MTRAAEVWLDGELDLKVGAIALAASGCGPLIFNIASGGDGLGTLAG